MDLSHLEFETALAGTLIQQERFTSLWTTWTTTCWTLSVARQATRANLTSAYHDRYTDVYMRCAELGVIFTPYPPTATGDVLPMGTKLPCKSHDHGTGDLPHMFRSGTKGGGEGAKSSTDPIWDCSNPTFSQTPWRKTSTQGGAKLEQPRNRDTKDQGGKGGEAHPLSTDDRSKGNENGKGSKQGAPNTNQGKGKKKRITNNWDTLQFDELFAREDNEVTVQKASYTRRDPRYKDIIEIGVEPGKAVKLVVGGHSPLARDVVRAGLQGRQTLLVTRDENGLLEHKQATIIYMGTVQGRLVRRQAEIQLAQAITT